MAKELADCDSIHSIVSNHAYDQHGGYFIGEVDYDNMLNDLNEREEALRHEKNAEIIKLKAQIKDMQQRILFSER